MVTRVARMCRSHTAQKHQEHSEASIHQLGFPKAEAIFLLNTTAEAKLHMSPKYYF